MSDLVKMSEATAEQMLVEMTHHEDPDTALSFIAARDGTIMVFSIHDWKVNGEGETVREALIDMQRRSFRRILERGNDLYWWNSNEHEWYAIDWTELAEEVENE